ncbi:MAG: hypothetical protein IKS17_08760 [Firmicutes bacterium]|nr:hypothetical protein [Bacillota bacterium]
MEEYDYTARRNQIRTARRAASPKKQSYFLLKFNMALAFGVTVLCADMIDLDVTNAFVGRVKSAVTQSESLDGIRQRFLSAVSSITGSGKISVFAGEEHPLTVDDALIEQMHIRESAYKNTQKKTP